MNSEYLEKIKEGDIETIRSLYKGKVYSSLKKYVVAQGGNNIDIQEIFADALVILITKLQNEDFVLTSSIEGYIYGMALNLWRSKLRKKSQINEIDISGIDEEEYDNLQILGNDLIKKEQQELLNKAMLESLAELNENCQSILKKFYFENKKMSTIAEELGYKNANMVRKLTHRCRQRLRILLSEKVGEYLENPNDILNK